MLHVQILAQQFFAGRLAPEMVFTCKQAGQAVARGVLTKVENPALLRDPKTHPASLNLNRYPVDILVRLRADFGVRASLVHQRLQVLLGERPDCRSPRIVRAILYLGSGDVDALDEAIDLARIDYRDLLLQAEYTTGADGEPTHVRDLSQPFDDAA